MSGSSSPALNGPVAFFWWWNLQSPWGAVVMGNNLSRAGESPKTIVVQWSCSWHCLVNHTYVLSGWQGGKVDLQSSASGSVTVRFYIEVIFLSVGMLCMDGMIQAATPHCWIHPEVWHISILKYIVFIWYCINIPGFELQYREPSSPQNVRYTKFLLAT